MPTLDDYIAKFFVSALDLNPDEPGESVPKWSKGNQVDFLIDGDEYLPVPTIRREVKVRPAMTKVSELMDCHRPKRCRRRQN